MPHEILLTRSGCQALVKKRIKYGLRDRRGVLCQCYPQRLKCHLLRQWFLSREVADANSHIGPFPGLTAKTWEQANGSNGFSRVKDRKDLFKAEIVC